jgi:hypothetical protein
MMSDAAPVTATTTLYTFSPGFVDELTRDESGH